MSGVDVDGSPLNADPDDNQKPCLAGSWLIPRYVVLGVGAALLLHAAADASLLGWLFR